MEGSVVRGQLDKPRYVPVENEAAAVRQALSVLVGQKFVGARVFGDRTWHFYFGQRSALLDDEVGSSTYVGTEFYWRVRKGDTTVVQSIDCDVEREAVERQEKTLRSMVGDAGLAVEWIEYEEPWGFSVGMEGGVVFEVFADNGTEVEWIFCCPSSYSLVLMNGVLNKAGPSPVDEEGIERLKKKIRERKEARR